MPNNPDSDGDGISDGLEDPDGDGADNITEQGQEGDPNDPIDSGLPPLKVDGFGPQGVEVTGTRTYTIPADGKSYLVVAYLNSAEYPQWTSEVSEFDDVLRWDVNPSNATAVAGSVSVNTLHDQWVESEANGTSFNGYSPIAQKVLCVVNPSSSDPITVDVLIGVTNVADGNLPSTAMIKLIPLDVDLDVNGDGDLDDPCDGLATYLPGYELDQPKLHIGTSFETAIYTGAQSMKLILENLPVQTFDELTVKIQDPSSWAGYCGNGEIPGESLILPYNDFSFDGIDAVNFSQEITVPVIDGTANIPIHCHDYGAWCLVEVYFYKDETLLVAQPLLITLPRDGNEDRLADAWQDPEITAWNNQFGTARPLDDTERDKMKPGTGHLFTDYADDETDDSDGAAGPLPAMAADGDGLSTLNEYRGYLLDAGPGVSSFAHRRLSTSRKEILVECSQMDGIGSTGGSITVPGFTDQGNGANAFAQAYSLNGVMSSVADLFAAEGAGAGGSPTQFPGAAIDVWWVKDKLDDDLANVVYENGNVRSAYKYSGTYYDLQLQANRNGWLSVSYDRELWETNRPDHNALYGIDTSAGVGIMANNDNRNNFCNSFVKLAIQGRKGKRNTDGSFVAPVNEAARERDDRHEPGNPRYQGAALFINSLSEESGIASQTDFDELAGYVFAHELAHLFIQNDEGHFTGIGNVLSVNGGDSISQTTVSEDEINNTNLPNRACIE